MLDYTMPVMADANQLQVNHPPARGVLGYPPPAEYGATTLVSRPWREPGLDEGSPHRTRDRPLIDTSDIVAQDPLQHYL